MCGLAARVGAALEGAHWKWQRLPWVLLVVQGLPCALALRYHLLELLGVENNCGVGSGHDIE